MTSSTQPSTLKLVRMNTLTQLVGYHRTHINLMIGEGRFPQRLKIGKRISVWLLPEINAWLDQTWKEGDSYTPPLLDAPRYLKRNDVLDILGIQKDMLYRMINQELFPQGKVLGYRERRWDYNDIMGWVAKKIQERDNQPC
ncbi:AlpA family phage regulatory protein [Vibrio natriegens]|uniref:helix-turn-helix transcriptional regulator n=1 Tax=Vibrio natriegens TaxID=691 RepID=UPI001EFD47FD|nr:AlpA family phage regulatory protein [Vibrio natriegens]MCG9702999.1 AlpA family phage regulatory protein [Vibrio natriegens]